MSTSRWTAALACLLFASAARGQFVVGPPPPPGWGYYPVRVVFVKRPVTVIVVPPPPMRLAAPSYDYDLSGIDLKEFFLVLSATGLAYRRCEVAWMKDDKAGVRFIAPSEKNLTQASDRIERPA